jgi:hypothetical protein
MTRLMTSSVGQIPSGQVEVETLPLAKGYDVLQQLTPLILRYQGTGSIGAVLLKEGELNQSIVVGGYTLTVSKIQNRRSTAVASSTAEAAPTYAMIITTGQNEYVIAASNAEITYSPATPGPPIAGLAKVQAGNYVNGVWIPGRWLNGDDVVLNYKLAEAAATNQSGSGLRFSAGSPSIQKVELYRYK